MSRSRAALGAFAIYLAVSFLAFGLRLLIEPGSQYIGSYDDPQITIWAFAWWPHALLHGQNPFVTHAVWPPVGVNLAWATSVPALSLAFAPLTLIAGAIASYNAAMVLLPALSAWAAFLLCRHLTAKWWPSLVGGYLYGFSSYILGHATGHPQLTAAFVVPLLALVVLQHLEGATSSTSAGRRLGASLRAADPALHGDGVHTGSGRREARWSSGSCSHRHGEPASQALSCRSSAAA